MATTINLNAQAEQILEAAKNSGVEQNFLFITTFRRYQVQLNMLTLLEKEMKESETLITKEYVKGRKNLYTNPSIAAYNRTADSANRTAAALIKIIVSLKGITLNVSVEDDEL